MATKKTSTKLKTKSAAVGSKSMGKTAYFKLRRWNIIIAVVLAVQAVLVLLIGKAFTLPVVTHYLAKDSIASQTAGRTVLAPAVRQIMLIDIRYIVIAFLLVGFTFYWLIATARRGKYEAELQNRTNTLRWVVYGLSSSIMLVLIAMLNGIYDIATLIAVFVLLGILHFLAYFGEAKAYDFRAKMQTFAAICVAGGTVWLIVFSYITGALAYGNGLNHFVYWIDGIVFAITLGLAYNKLQLYREGGRWADYIFGEKVFMILSFSAMTLLTWLVFAGFLS